MTIDSANEPALLPNGETNFDHYSYGSSGVRKISPKNGQITIDQALKAGREIGQVAFDGTNPVATRPFTPFFADIFNPLDLGK